MTTMTMGRGSVRRDVADPVADLRVAHNDVATIVAELDLDDADLWREGDAIVSEITAAAYAMISQVTDAPADVTASRVPPIVRVRELATAQRRLFAALGRRPALDHQLVEEASRRVRSLGQLLRCVALSGATIEGDRGGG